MKDVAADVYWDDFGERAKSYLDCQPLRLTRLTIHLTNNCNLACKYCNMERSNNYIDYNHCSFLIREFASLHDGKKIIHFTGGEPTTHPHFEKLIFEAYQNGLKVSVSTNAVKTIGDLSPITKLKCSFDDHRNMDDVYRVKGATGKIIDSLKYYNDNIRLDQVFSLTCLISPLNFTRLAEIADHVHAYYPRIHNLYFTVHKGYGTPAFALGRGQADYVCKSEIPKIQEVFGRHSDKYSAKQLAIYKPTDFVDGDRFPEVDFIPCYIQMSELTVGCDYKVYNCSHLYRDGGPYVPGIDIRQVGLRSAFGRAKLGCMKVPMAPQCKRGCNRNLQNFNIYIHNELKNKGRE